MGFRFVVTSGHDARHPRTIAYLTRFGTRQQAVSCARAIRERRATRSSVAVLLLGAAGVIVPAGVGIVALLIFGEVVDPVGTDGLSTPQGFAMVVVIVVCGLCAAPFFIWAERYPDLASMRTAARHAETRRCVACRYDMASHASENPAFHNCPECGQATPVTPEAETRTITP